MADGPRPRKRRRQALGSFLTGNDPDIPRSSRVGLRLGPVSHKPRPVTPPSDSDDSFSRFWQEAAQVSDTMAALNLLRSTYPSVSGNHDAPPIILEHHVYSIVSDRTVVDVELHQLLQKGRIRRFHSPTGQDEVIILFMDDYLKQIHAARSRTSPQRRHVFDRFESILPKCLTQYLLKDGLIDMLHGAVGASEITKTTNDIDLLVHYGLLVGREPNTTMWFGVPNGGPFIADVERGRTEILRILDKATYGEILISDLGKRKLRTSAIPPKWFVRDLIGLGLARELTTQAGNMLKLNEQ